MKIETEQKKYIVDTVKGDVIVPGDKVLYEHTGKNVLAAYVGITRQNTLRFKNVIDNVEYNVRPASIGTIWIWEKADREA